MLFGVTIFEESQFYFKFVLIPLGVFLFLLYFLVLPYCKARPAAVTHNGVSKVSVLILRIYSVLC